VFYYDCLYCINNSAILNNSYVCTLTVFNVYTVIDGVTVCASRLWPTQEEHFKEALQAYILLFESTQL